MFVNFLALKFMAVNGYEYIETFFIYKVKKYIYTDFPYPEE